jgi:putative oxidoreductase
MQLLNQCYRSFIRFLLNLESPLLLAVRLYWGWQFMQAGWGKLNSIDKVISFFNELGIPAPAVNAWFVAGLEFAGGILLMIGLGSRLIALPLVIDMIVAYITADREALLSMISAPDKFIAAAPFSFLLASLIILVFGAGKFSADALFAQRMATDRVREWIAAGDPVTVMARPEMNETPSSHI